MRCSARWTRPRGGLDGAREGGDEGDGADGSPRVRAIGEGAAALEFGEEFALDALVAERDTFKCKCGKPFAAAMNATRHVASGQCTWNKDDEEEEEEGPEEEQGSRTGGDEGAAHGVRGDVSAGEGGFFQIDRHGQGRQGVADQVLVPGQKEPPRGSLPDRISPGEDLGPGRVCSHLAKVRRAIERLGIFDGDKDLNGSADIVGEAVKVSSSTPRPARSSATTSRSLSGPDMEAAS